MVENKKAGAAQGGEVVAQNKKRGTTRSEKAAAKGGKASGEVVAESKKLGVMKKRGVATTSSGKGEKKCKYIFVTGGVLSGVGKGITAASIGAILKAKGFKVSIQKCDPYLNVDAGLLNPVEHGECFVTADGKETDLDLGHYERFLDFETSQYSSVLSGALYRELIEKERSGGFRGKTVQMIPHFTNLVQEKIEKASEGSDVHIVEIGGTVGDYEGLSFIEAIRLFANRVGRENCLYVHVVYVPWINTSKELKTKPAQNALKDLRGFGIIPDVVVCRTERPAPREVCEKIAAFSGIPGEAVLNLPDIESVYDVPFNVLKSGVLEILNRFVGDEGEPDMSGWEEFSRLRAKKWAKTVKVALVAKYVGNDDAYICVTEALKAAAAWNKVSLEIIWINAEDLADDTQTSSLADARLAYRTPSTARSDAPAALNSTHPEQDQAWQLLEDVDGIVVPGGFGARGAEGKIRAARYALEHDKPYLGLCLGMQAAVIAAARLGSLSSRTSSLESASAQSTHQKCASLRSSTLPRISSKLTSPNGYGSSDDLNSLDDQNASTVEPRISSKLTSPNGYGSSDDLNSLDDQNASTVESRVSSELASLDGQVDSGNASPKEGVLCGSEEFGASEEAGNNVIYIMEGQKGKEQTGGTMRLGDYPAKLVKGSKVAGIYGTEEVTERHRHRYEVNQKFLPEIEEGGLVVSGTSPDGKLMEFVESPKNKFFVATQAHPEFRSRPLRVHPLFKEFVKSLK